MVRNNPSPWFWVRSSILFVDIGYQSLFRVFRFYRLRRKMTPHKVPLVTEKELIEQFELI